MSNLPSASRDESAPTASPASLRRAGLAAIATVGIVAAVLLFARLSSLGLWDPYELSLADQGCRAAANHHAFPMSACGADAAARATDARAAIMIRTVEFGFRVFGVTEAAGRIPLALWIVVGALAISWAVSRLVDARAALYAGAVFVTMPTALTQGRLILGDAVTLGAFALALAGAAVAAFDRRGDDRDESVGARAFGLALAVVGTLAAIGARGLAVGCAPALAVGLAWLVRVGNADHEDEPHGLRATLVALGVIVVGVVVGVRASEAELGKTTLQSTTGLGLVALPTVAAALGAFAFSGARRFERAAALAFLAVGAAGVSEGLAVASHAAGGSYVAAVGMTGVSSRKFPTYDLLVRQIAHGTFPWGCLLPFAFGRALARPVGAQRDDARRALDLRVTALLAAALTYGVQTFVAPNFGLAPFAAPVALAVVIGLVLRDLERAPAASLVIAIGTAVFAGLVLNDFFFEDLAKSPVELATAPILEPYGIYGVAAPEELRLRLRIALAAAGAVFLLPVFFVWVDEDPRPSWTPPAVLRRPIDATIAAWRDPFWGLLLLLAVSFEACAGVLGVLVWRRALRTKITLLQALPVAQRDVIVNLWWYPLAAVALALVGYVGFMVGRDLFRNARQHRVATIAMGGLLAACIWSFSVMPAVANQFSPKGVFATYRQKGQGAPIALLGVNARTAAYELSNATPAVVADAKAGFEWLHAGDAPRKFLALKSEGLPELNRLWREREHTNLPVLDGRSAQILLASNVLDGTSQNPLDRLVLDAPPSIATSDPRCSAADGPICVPSHALDCDIDGKLRCVGWELFDASGRPATVVGSGQRVRLRQIYRVTARISGSWQVFIHVEQQGTATARKTSDHVPLNGKYGFDNWLPGDIVVDDSEFNLEPNMKSGVPVTILTGFFSGSSRMPLVSGPDAGAETEGARLLLGRVQVQ